MPVLTKEEKDFIKKNEALPKNVIAGRLSELMDEMLSSEEGEDFKVKRLFSIELRRWLKTIRIFSQKDLKVNKENFI